VQYQNLELRISLQKLLIGLTAAIVPLSLVGLYVTNEGDHSAQQTTGVHFRAIAQSKWDQVSQFLDQRRLACEAIGRDQTVREAIEASNHANRGLSQAAIDDNTGKIASQWNQPAGEGPAKGIIESKASRFLRGARELDPHFLGIIVSDESGLTVAATEKPVKYLQSGMPYWLGVYADGRGSIHAGDVRYDEAGKSTFMTIAVPVRGEDSGGFIGALYAVIDVSPLFPLFNDTPLGPGVKTMLTRQDGTIIASQNTSLAMNLKPEEYAAVRDGMVSFEGRQAGFVSDVRGGARSARRIVGFADTGIQPDSLNLGWIVMVSQDEREATAATGAIGTFALAMVVLSCLMLILLLVYFFLHRPQTFEDIEVLHGIEKHGIEKETPAPGV
jgi:hypothetical protein